MNRRRHLLHRVRIFRGALFAALLLSPGISLAQEAGGHAVPEPLVAAASDLQFALDEIVERFRRDTGTGARATYGSSGNFARQINKGHRSSDHNSVFVSIAPLPSRSCAVSVAARKPTRRFTGRL